VHITAHKNTPVDLWPAEPLSPNPVNDDQFSAALLRLCGDEGAKKAKTLSMEILEAAAIFSVDPFLLGALVFDGSRCRPGTTKWDAALGRFGPTRMPLEMHRPQIQKGVYRYFLGTPGAFVERSLDVSKYSYKEATLRASASNVYFAAAVLAVFKAQHPDLDKCFQSVPHRHFVSHFFYGDRVGGPEPENRVLTARRRLLEYYAGTLPNRVVGHFKEMPLSCPLDGSPRLVLDYFGNLRGNKEGMGHRGIDIDAAEGEPVRAAADGTVVFAGMDLRGGTAHKQLTLAQVDAVTESDLGPGGFYVSLNHGNDFGTIYMHLSALAVTYLDSVKRGDIIGYAGKSGAKKSGPHLHLEFRVETHRADPAEPLASVLVNPYRLSAKKK